ncbi:MAG: hypothetical protein ABIL68_05715 [bacterium]
MKPAKQWTVGFLFFSLLGFAQGQGVRILELNGGYVCPKDMKAGLMFGGSYGISIDERVDLSLGLSYFHKNYTRTSAVADTDFVSGVHETTVMKELEYSTTLLPVFASLNIRIPFAPPVFWYFGGSITYRFLVNKEMNFEQSISEKRNYRGWGWMARAGIEYAIGSRSSIILEALYNIGKVKRNVKETVEGLPIWDEVDVSGFGFRAGVRLEFF